jgi:hypothetical protein
MDHHHAGRIDGGAGDHQPLTGQETHILSDLPIPCPDCECEHTGYVEPGITEKDWREGLVLARAAIAKARGK